MDFDFFDDMPALTLLVVIAAVAIILA